MRIEAHELFSIKVFVVGGMVGGLEYFAYSIGRLSLLPICILGAATLVGTFWLARQG